jgi:hypothetical protein
MFPTGECADLASTDRQLKAAGLCLGYGGFASLILQYRVTIFAIPLAPMMDMYVMKPPQDGGFFRRTRKDGVSE